MTEQKSKEMTYFTACEALGLIKSPISTNTKIKEEFDDFEDDFQDARFGNQSKQNIVFSGKMIKNFQKRVISGELDREVAEKSRNNKHMRESSKSKAD